VVYWQPPKHALDKVKELVWEPSISRYGADEGIPELRAALVKKVHVLRHITLTSSLLFRLEDSRTWKFKDEFAYNCNLRIAFFFLLCSWSRKINYTNLQWW